MDIIKISKNIITNRVIIFIFLYSFLDYKIKNTIKSFILAILFIIILEKSKTLCILEPFKIKKKYLVKKE